MVAPNSATARRSKTFLQRAFLSLGWRVGPGALAADVTETRRPGRWSGRSAGGFLGVFSGLALFTKNHRE